MGLAVLVLGLVLFIGSHVFITMRDRRADAIARFGEGGYKGAIGLLSFAGIGAMAWGFAEYRAEGEWVELWNPPVWTQHLAALLMWPAVVMVTATYVPGNIKRVLKHPMLSGIKLWAVAHLMSNGDLGSVLLFGGFLGWAVFDRITLKRRTDPGGPPIPVGGRRNDILAVVIGTILYLALAFVFHPLVIGRAVFGTPALGT